jgi:hypothetical protein
LYRTIKIYSLTVKDAKFQNKKVCGFNLSEGLRANLSYVSVLGSGVCQ